MQFLNFDIHFLAKRTKMKSYQLLTKEELNKEYEALKKKYEEYVSRGLKLDISRGKPNSSQLDISSRLLEAPLPREECFSAKGVDLRNYGDTYPEIKGFFSRLYGIKEERIVVGGNSSLQLMYDNLMRAMLFGLKNSPKPWCREEKLKWLCVVPGYDRHFLITEKLGFELINVRMTETGPDMDEVERLVKDPAVKGIWCVPKYSNPTGNTYSDETVERLVKMECAAPDFTIMWDNAYALHDIADEGDELADIFELAEKYGNLDRVFYFSSTSKITFPGAGISIFAASENNLSHLKPYMSAQTIGYDKLNQLRHARFFGEPENVKLHMKRHAEFLKKKFDITLNTFEKLSGLGIAEWTQPRGGYFVSLDVVCGSAKRVYELMKGAGVILTTVGATYPYGIDPKDENLRIAPTYPQDDELLLALEILVVAVKLSAIEALLSK